MVNCFPIWIGWRIWNVQILFFKEWNNDWMKAKFKCGSDRRICDRIMDLSLRLKKIESLILATLNLTRALFTVMMLSPLLLLPAALAQVMNRQISLSLLKSS